MFQALFLSTIFVISLVPCLDVETVLILPPSLTTHTFSWTPCSPPSLHCHSLTWSVLPYSYVTYFEIHCWSADETLINWSVNLGSFFLRAIGDNCFLQWSREKFFKNLRMKQSSSARHKWKVWENPAGVWVSVTKPSVPYLYFSFWFLYDAPTS